MTFPRYPDYKDSGVEWLGEVPAHWTLPKLKHFTKFFGGGTPSRENLSFWNGDIPWVSPKDMKAERIHGAEECITETGLMNSTSSLMPAGMILLVVRSGILKHTIPVAINDVPAALNQDMKALSFDEGSCLNAFLLRWVQGLNDLLLLVWAKQGATVESIEHAYLAETVVPLPPFTEQQTIANFLDRETAKIDSLIAEQQRLIELLKEKRQTVISHAVTKGLNPETPMKDSGIEWLGEVPAHWEVKRLRFIAEIQSGIAKGKDNSGQETIEVPYLRVANVQDGFLDLESVTTIEIPANSLDRYRLRVGDVLMNEGGDYDKLGRGHIWNGEIEPCIHQNHVFAIRPKSLSSEWLNEITGSDYAQFYFMTHSKQSTNLASISSTNIMELPVVLPPPTEQQQILTAIRNQRIKLDNLTAEAQRAIELLKERRAALISAAVTGKIDVRGLA
jgi:type I restriction enzyme S subunit